MLKPIYNKSYASYNVPEHRLRHLIQLWLGMTYLELDLISNYACLEVKEMSGFSMLPAVDHL